MSFVQRNGGFARTGGTNSGRRRYSYSWCHIERSIKNRSREGHQGILCGTEEESQAASTRHGGPCKQFYLLSIYLDFIENFFYLRGKYGGNVRLHHHVTVFQNVTLILHVYLPTELSIVI